MALTPWLGVEAWHCLPVVSIFSQVLLFSETSIMVESAMPKSGTRMRSFSPNNSPCSSAT